MFHWYICGIIDAIRHPIITTTTTTTTQSQQYFVPSITTRRRLSFLLYILDPHRRRRHMEESQQNRVVLLATTRPQQHSHKTVVVGRFGIVIEPGPVVPSPLQEAIHRIYTNHKSNRSSNNSNNISTTTSSSSTTATIKNDDDTIRAGAIVYMYVAPEYRGIQNNIGGMALQVIHTIQRSCHCTYTLLVANDKTPPSDTSTTTTTTTARTGSDHDNDATTAATTNMRYNDMKLVQWYRRNGYHIAEEIQDMLGSPNGIYGVAMITSHHDNNTMNYDVATPIIQWW